MIFKRYHPLTGVDDRTIERTIERRALWQALTATRLVVLAAAIGVLCFVIDRLLLIRFFPVNHDLIKAVLVGLGASFSLNWSLVEKRLKCRSQILGELGRCTNCGYRLTGEYEKSCPECNHGNGEQPPQIGGHSELLKRH